MKLFSKSFGERPPLKKGAPSTFYLSYQSAVFKKLCTFHDWNPQCRQNAARAHQGWESEMKRPASAIMPKA
ncbi:hypothetical protein [Komagataeibacter diospyri]|uniref:hypothetical protein n=1 Tax=Komagataeibacter diospyri TaxID=1932662 RepID=UPI00375738E9